MDWVPSREWPMTNDRCAVAWAGQSNPMIGWFDGATWHIDLPEGSRPMAYGKEPHYWMPLPRIPGTRP